MDIAKILNWIRFNRPLKRLLSVENQLNYLKHLHFLMVHGYSFNRALNNMNWNANYVQPSKIIIDCLKKGETIDHAFEKANFHPSIVAYLQFANEHENMQESIRHCVEMFEHRVHYIERFKKTLRYPAFLLVILSLLLIGLNRFILPMFLQLFQSNTSSSKSLLFSISLMEFITRSIIILMIIGLVFFFIWSRYKSRISIETQLHIYKKIPIYRSFYTLYTTYYLVTYISMYLKASLPMKKVMEQLEKHDRLLVLAHYGKEIRLQLQAGYSLDVAVQRLYFIDDQTKSLFSQPLNDQSFEKELSIYAIFLGEKIRDVMESILKSIQPVIFTIVALFIVFVYMTLMLPMYQLIQTV